MGTRGLTMVISGNKTKVAQYGQWDHYPSGQGLTALNFIRKAKKDGFAHFKGQLDKVRFSTKKDETEVEEYLESIGSKDGWMNISQAELYHQKYPLLTRDNGAKILELIDKSGESEMFLTDSSSFNENSLFCEYAYVLDLDKGTFEVYNGFNKVPLDVTERFYKATPSGNYYPIRHLITFRIDKLPTKSAFISACNKAMDKLENA